MEVTRRQRRRRKKLLDDLKERDDTILETERGSTRWHSAKNSLLKMDFSCLRLLNECMNG